MRNNIAIILLFVCFLTILNSCSKYSPSLSLAETCTEPHSQSTSEHFEPIIDFTYPPSFKPITETQHQFYEIVEDNPIDQAYFNETIGHSTLQLREHELKYAEIWKKELEHSMESFLLLLDDNQKTQFMNLQCEWTNNLNEEFALIRDLSTAEKYGVHFGSAFLFESAHYYREILRERTLYIKYLYFCINNEVVFHSQKAEEQVDGSLVP